MLYSSYGVHLSPQAEPSQSGRRVYFVLWGISGHDTTKYVLYAVCAACILSGLYKNVKGAYLIAIISDLDEQV